MKVTVPPYFGLSAVEIAADEDGAADVFEGAVVSVAEGWVAAPLPQDVSRNTVAPRQAIAKHNVFLFNFSPPFVNVFMPKSFRSQVPCLLAFPATLHTASPADLNTGAADH